MSNFFQDDNRRDDRSDRHHCGCGQQRPSNDRRHCGCGQQRPSNDRNDRRHHDSDIQPIFTFRNVWPDNDRRSDFDRNRRDDRCDHHRSRRRCCWW